MDVQSPSVVPKGLTIGLAIFAVLLGLAGFGFRLMFGDSLSSMLPSLVSTIAIFWLGIPLAFVVGSQVLNRYSGRAPIQNRNALTLGLLFSCVAMLWMMAVYS